MALAMKKGLYRAIKPYREGTLIDDELRIAADGFIIAVPREANGPAWLEIRPRQTLSELEAQLSSLGLDDQELLSPEERRLAQNLDQFISDDPVVPLPVKRSTPFYTRED